MINMVNCKIANKKSDNWMHKQYFIGAKILIVDATYKS